MGRFSAEKELGMPEKVVDLLLSHLKRHALWDSLLMFFPPLLVFSYLTIFLYHSSLITRETLFSAGASLLGVALLIGILRHRPLTPVRFVARLIDDRVEGKDRFVTLATIDPSFHPASLVARLRHEAAGLLHRVDLKKDFPYRAKRSFFASLIGSLVVILLFHLFLQIVPLFTLQAPPIKELAQKLSHMPRFSELSRSLEAMALRMQEQDLFSAERRSLIQELLREVEDQLAAERQEGGDGSDLLSQAANALRGMERGLEKGQEGGGGLRTNLPEEGKGKGNELARGDKGEGQDELSVSTSKDLTGGKSAQGEMQEASKRQGERDQDRRDRLKGGRGKGKEIAGMAKGELEGRGGKSKGEEIPSGATPERFLQPGEQGEKGIKGARFVTVQLPEDETEDSDAEGGSGKRRKLRPKVPVSNVPLRRPDAPDAAPEKQPLPLEYRRLIR